ncbi:Na/Pi cotransporter family protein [Ketobacter sp.]|uniref:Na/Pi cotransporter family protein n=1 Tax=Ketobacter sp. TaxID=2083498 RepID=UPI000F2C1374|nr:Na/Pi symporter [Ketobacter sp.]RLU01862.1 MAG: Na/Pi cotransporter family protein [Ketobacter sp.]
MLVALGTVLGGVGIFLLGMIYLTDGLKQSAGEKLDEYLHRGTNTKRRGFFSGFLLTALVQSSSVITVATIGFVNARLLTMGQAVWVVFGSNVGTTMTAWIVALIGFKINVQVFALPMVGLGAFIHILSKQAQWRALGGALAGFGLLFVGLDFMQASMKGYEEQFLFLDEGSFDLQHVIILLLMGFLMTVVMQSSSASMAMILTLVNGGVIPLPLGAAAVIGANVGTTSTALLATIGATANAKRVAWAHVSFNVVAAAVALLLLPLVSTVFTTAYNRELAGGNAAFWLAIYHSLFNLLGVLIMIPLEPRVTRMLTRRFKKREGAHFQLRYLDKNIVSMPPLALQSISKELDNLAQLVASVIVREEKGPDTHDQIEQLQRLLEQFDGYVVATLRQPMAPINADAFSKIIKSSQSLLNALQWYQLTLQQGARPKDPAIEQILLPFELSFREFIQAVAAEEDHLRIQQRLEQVLAEAERVNRDVFTRLRGHAVFSSDVSLATQWVAWHRRIAQQMMKVLRRVEEIDDLMHPQEPSVTLEQNQTAEN